jgi:serine phosphatase RsbU (regulator of sigma subunit)
MAVAASGAEAGRDAGSRWVRGDGSIVWCSMVTAPVPGADGRPETLVGIMEDITERKRHAELAAKIQRDLLPVERPRLEGYELAAACLPARDVAGDFYDWRGPEDGHLDLTVADTARGGPGAALVMATVRMALRTMPRGLPPGPRVALVAESISQELADDAHAIALFHARLDIASGTLRYLDAGLGCSAIRRAAGGLEHLPVRRRSLAGAGDGAAEGRVELAPGDALIVSTDGLLTAAGGMERLEEMLTGLDPAMSADEMVASLAGSARGRRRDDATVMVLRRTGGVPSPPEGEGTAAL